MWKRLRSLLAELLPGVVKSRALRAHKRDRTAQRGRSD